MSARTILDNDFEFNNLHLNKLQFSDNTIQDTAYQGNSPLPSQVIYNIPINTEFTTNFNGYSTLLETINLVNLHTGFMGVLYFQDSSFNNLNSFNINFSSSDSGDLEITLFNTINSLPYYTSNFASSLFNNSTGTLTFGDIIITKTGSVIASFNNISVVSSTIYTLKIYTCTYA
jgi:hypothetical protein